MISHTQFLIISAIWMFGWGIVLLLFPRFVALFYQFAKGKEASAKDFKVARVVGWMGIFFGCVVLVQLLLVLRSQ